MFLAGISSWGRKVGRRLELLTISDRLHSIIVVVVIVIIIDLTITIILTIFSHHF